MGLVASASKIPDLAKVESEANVWEGYPRTLGREFRETSSDTVNVGILPQILPKKALDNEVK